MHTTPRDFICVLYICETSFVFCICALHLSFVCEIQLSWLTPCDASHGSMTISCPDHTIPADLCCPGARMAKSASSPASSQVPRLRYRSKSSPAETPRAQNADAGSKYKPKCMDPKYHKKVLKDKVKGKTEKGKEKKNKDKKEKENEQKKDNESKKKDTSKEQKKEAKEKEQRLKEQKDKEQKGKEQKSKEQKEKVQKEKERKEKEPVKKPEAAAPTRPSALRKTDKHKG